MNKKIAMLRKVREENPKLFGQMLMQMTPEEQRKILYNWDIWGREKQLEPEGKWRFWVGAGGRSAGKDLADSTPILTANRGWTTMGDLLIGDIVFDEQGNQTTVIDKYIPPKRKLYKFTFRDGSELISSEEHEWVTWTHRDRKQYNRNKNNNVFPPSDWAFYSGEIYHGASKNPVGKYGPQKRTTKEIIDTFTIGKRKDSNHCIPLCSPLKYEEQSLIIDPYLLGYWLGDGSSSCATITIHDSDTEVLEYFNLPYVRYKTDKDKTSNWGIDPRKPENRNGCFQKTNGFYAKLKDLNLLNNKHIPRIYFSGSIEQRLELLRGLCDSDGYVDPDSNAVEFVSIKKNLADDVLELAISLGLRATLAEGNATLNGRFISKKYRVTWTDTIGCFKLKRKAKVFDQWDKTKYKNRHRMIYKYEEVEWEPTSCIEVDSQSHLFLAGKSLIPTHNTRTGSEWIIKRAKAGLGPIALVGQTSADVRDVMIELGPSSIMQVCPPDFMPVYEPSKRRLTFPNGVTATTFSGDEPGQLRGPQHQTIWVDELPKMDNPQETFDQLNFGLRIGDSRCLITTTPTPDPVMKNLYKQWEEDPQGRVRYVIMPTQDNKDNIDPEFLKDIEDRYMGTRLYRQEVLGEILWESEDALFNSEILDEYRVDDYPELESIAIAVDIATTSKKKSDHTGIVVAGLGIDGHGYVLSDKTMKGTPSQWAERVVALYDYYSDIAPTHIVIETNQGGDLIRHTLEQVRYNLPIKEVRASKSKISRMEPVSLLAEQGKIHIVGLMPELEDQLVSYNGKGPSPDRYDAMCYTITSLMVAPQKSIITATTFYL